jgi:2-oxoglutarate ferredoxin oxidoreductase subunit gamma
MVLVAMNRPSLERFGPQVKSGGLIIINSSMIDIDSGRKDVRHVMIPANAEAQKAGSDKAANMVVLGAFIALPGAATLESITHWMEHQFEGKAKVIETNKIALKVGFELAKAQEVTA